MFVHMLPDFNFPLTDFKILAFFENAPPMAIKKENDYATQALSGRAAAWRKLSWAAVLSSWLPTNYQPRCYLHSHAKNLMHFQINKGCAKIHFVSINFFLKHPFNCPICENTESIPQKITSRLPGEPK